MSKKKIMIWMVGLVIFISFTINVFFYRELHQTKTKLEQLKQDPQTLIEKENKEVAKRVAQMLDVPKDEEPVVITITEIERLKNQPFFAKAQIGDKVLVYSKARKAVLYDPKSNKILEVGPLLFPQETAAPSTNTPTGTTDGLFPRKQTATASSSLKVYLYNGTTTVGLTGKVAPALLDKIPQVTIVDRDNAQKKDYKQTLVVDLTGGRRGKEARLVAETIGAKVSSLPAGEKKPQNSDLLVIVGEDKK